MLALQIRFFLRVLELELVVYPGFAISALELPGLMFVF